MVEELQDPQGEVHLGSGSKSSKYNTLKIEKENNQLIA